MRDRYDVIVIGGGHAGTEAAWAAASVLGESAHIALITMDASRIGQMSCNPAIGGLAKGQMVGEIDALGGLMGLAIDATGVMFKVLNTSKGAAVRGPRAQADKYAYAAEVQRLISTRPNIEVVRGTVEDIVVEGGRVVGVMVPAGVRVVEADRRAIEWNVANAGRARPVYGSPLPPGESLGEGGRPHVFVATHGARAVDDDEGCPSPPAPLPGGEGSLSPLPAGEGLGEGGRGERAAAPRATLLRSSAVVLTTGTFMRGLLHTGERKVVGGRMGEGSAVGISDALRRLGFELGRLKTGTPPRLARETIDWDGLPAQAGDTGALPFSDLSPQALPAGVFPHLPQAECRMSHTTAEGHEVIRANLARAPLFSGQIEADCGPRYCPSIEDKIVRFPDRDEHHVFLEPESLHTNEIYCNGIATSLPIDVQDRLVHLMPGCERAVILKWGYAVEYDMVWPHQIDSTCLTKGIEGLYLAGQINCTTGYEEAGGQGLLAGLNAARGVAGREAVRLGRDEAYIGVLMDDLVTKTPREPYRMFTSRAEHRLLLRADNADERLTGLGREWGLVDGRRWAAFERRQVRLAELRRLFDQVMVGGRTLREVARRPEATAEKLARHLDGAYEPRLVDRVVTEAKYEGYIARQRAEIRRQRAADRRQIPAWLDVAGISGLRAEAAEVLGRFRPKTIGQAGRLAGVNPADLTLLAVAIKRGPAPGSC